MIKLENINISFSKVNIIENSNFESHQGLLTAISGKSSSGKSSLLNILSLYSYQKDFDYFFEGKNLKNFEQNELNALMKYKISYLRQQCTFLETMSCLDNIKIECAIAGIKTTEKEIKAILEKVALNRKENMYPSKLSGGEKQRLAIAMAIAKNSDLILCDEITSSLDEVNTKKIINLLQDLAHHQGKTVIIASHEDYVIDACDEIYCIENKHIYKKENKEPKFEPIICIYR